MFDIQVVNQISAIPYTITYIRFLLLQGLGHSNAGMLNLKMLIYCFPYLMLNFNNAKSAIYEMDPCT